VHNKHRSTWYNFWGQPQIFGELVFRNGQLHSGIVLLRLQDESSANRVHTIRAVLERYADRLAGCFNVVTDRGVRIRPFQDIV